MDQQEASTPGPGRRPARRGMRSGIFAAGAAFGITLAGLGIAGAQTSPTATAPETAPAEAGAARHRPGHHLSAAADAIGISEEDLVAARRGGQSIAQLARSRNVAVQTVIDAMVADARDGLVERITALVNRAGLPEGRGPGHGRHRAAHVAAHLDVAAQAIGVSPVELRTALRDGQSIAQVARSKNVDVQKVVDALVADARSRLAAKVTAGELTQAEADEKAARLTERVTALVNRTGGLGGRPHR
jgi:DNA-binding Lrp family transcriptional regulator